MQMRLQRWREGMGGAEPVAKHGHPAILCSFWQRSFHDEGSCWVPAVLRPAIILSHWGHTEFPHASGMG